MAAKTGERRRCTFVITMMWKVNRKHEKEIVLKTKSNTETFWSHIRRRLKTKTGIAPFLENNKDKISTKFNDFEKANIPLLGNITESSICHFNAAEEMIHNELFNLNVNKWCGPNDIHPGLLNELVATISKPIAFLFNKSMQYGKVLLDWKKQIFHQSTKNVCEIEWKIIVQLTSILCKIMEKL